MSEYTVAVAALLEPWILKRLCVFHWQVAFWAVRVQLVELLHIHGGALNLQCFCTLALRAHCQQAEALLDIRRLSMTGDEQGDYPPSSPRFSSSGTKLHGAVLGLRSSAVRHRFASSPLPTSNRFSW